MSNSPDTETLSSDSSLVWRGVDVPRLYIDITDEAEINGLDILNYDNRFGVAETLFGRSGPSALGQKKEKNGEESTETNIDWVQSDVDKQLMIFIPFQSAIGIHSIQITSLPPPTSEDDSDSLDDEVLMRLRQIKLYANLSHNLSFETAEDFPTTQTFELGPHDWDDKTGTAQLQLRFVKFQNINSLVMFTFDGEGTGDKVRLDRVRIIGKSGAKRNPGKLRTAGQAMGEHGIPIICLNEGFGIHDLEKRLRNMDTANFINTGLQAAERAETLTLDLDRPPGLDADGFCECYARAVRTWRDPRIAVEVFNPQFEAPTFTIPEVEHHRSLASLNDCGNDQKCPLCKMVYSAIIYSAKEERSRMRLQSKLFITIRVVRPTVS